MELQPTVELIAAAQEGSAEAMDRLLGRYLQPLTRWAHGRLPQWARDYRDTQDIVQDVVADTLRQLPRLEIARDGALHAYLKTAITNRIRNELRSSSRRPGRAELHPDIPSQLPSAFDLAFANEKLERYEQALRRLDDADREAVIARLEFGLSGAELAAALEKSSVDAARMAVSRALKRLARLLADSQSQ